MNVNWQNLTIAIRNGQSAYQGADFGSPIDNGTIGFYDHPMSDLSEAVQEAYRNRPNDFIIGTHKWGQDEIVTE